MDDYQPTDDEIEMLLLGRPTGHEPEGLVEVFDALSSWHLDVSSVAPDAALREFVDASWLDEPAMTMPSIATKERSTVRKLATSVGAVAATTAGKLALATAVAATTVGGAGAAGVIELPGNRQGDRPVTVIDVSDDPPLVVEVDTGAPEDADRGDRPETHGSEISGQATDSEQRGCDFGRSIAEAASAQADDHRQDDGRELPDCAHEGAPGQANEKRDQERPGPPADPGKPEDPGPPVTTPVDPGKPDDPGPAVTTPVDPGKPEDPGPAVTTPVDPGKPEDPGPPVTTPVDPGKPEDPGRPADRGSGRPS